MAHRPLVRLVLASLLGATIVPFAAVADPFPIPPQRLCAAPAAGSQTDSRLIDKIAAAERALDDRQPNVWPKLAQLAQYACVLGARAAVEPLLQRCLRECADDRDRYVTHIAYASLLEGSGDLLGAETQYSAAIASRADPADAVTAYYNYALLLDRSGRPQDALNLLNRLPQDPRTTSAVMPLKRWVMGELGIDTKDLLATMPRAPVGGPTDIPLSAIPIEDNPLAQSPFAQRIEVSSDVWVEPKNGATAVQPAHLYYHRAHFADPSTFEKRFQIKQGEHFDVVADLGESGCRILFRANRYDLDDCPWRSSPTSAAGAVFHVIGTVRSPPPLEFKFEPPVSTTERPESVPAPQ